MFKLSDKYTNGQAMVKATDVACRCPRMAVRGPGCGCGGVQGRRKARARLQTPAVGTPSHCARMWHRGRVTGNIEGAHDHLVDNVADSNEHLPEEAQPHHVARARCSWHCRFHSPPSSLSSHHPLSIPSRRILISSPPPPPPHSDLNYTRARLCLRT